MGCYQKKRSYEGSHHFRGMKHWPTNCQNNSILWYQNVGAKTLDYRECSLSSTFPLPGIYHEETKQGLESLEPSQVLLRAVSTTFNLVSGCLFFLDLWEAGLSKLHSPSGRVQIQRCIFSSNSFRIPKVKHIKWYQKLIAWPFFFLWEIKTLWDLTPGERLLYLKQTNSSNPMS